MYSDENYLWGMIGYYLGCFLVLLFLWRFRELLPGRHFRNQLLLLIASLILVPIKAYPDTGYLAPAWFVSLFEGLTGPDPLGFMRGAQPIMICYLTLSLLYVTWLVLAKLLRRTGGAETDLSPD